MKRELLLSSGKQLIRYPDRYVTMRIDAEMLEVLRGEECGFVTVDELMCMHEEEDDGEGADDATERE